MGDRCCLILKHDHINEALHLAHEQLVMSDKEHRSHLILLNTEGADLFKTEIVIDDNLTTVEGAGDAFPSLGEGHIEDGVAAFLQDFLDFMLPCVVDNDLA